MRAWRGIPAIADRAVVISSFGKTYHDDRLEGRLLRGARCADREIQGVHQWIVFSVNGAVQMAFADIVASDPACESVTAVLSATSATCSCSWSPDRAFVLLTSQGTFFQMLDYSDIADEPTATSRSSDSRAWRGGDSAVPVPPRQ